MNQENPSHQSSRPDGTVDTGRCNPHQQSKNSQNNMQLPIMLTFGISSDKNNTFKATITLTFLSMVVRIQHLDSVI